MRNLILLIFAAAILAACQSNTSRLMDKCELITHHSNYLANKVHSLSDTDYYTLVDTLEGVKAYCGEGELDKPDGTTLTRVNDALETIVELTNEY